MFCILSHHTRPFDALHLSSWDVRCWEHPWHIRTLNLNQHLSPPQSASTFSVFSSASRKIQFHPQCLSLSHPLSHTLQGLFPSFLLKHVVLPVSVSALLLLQLCGLCLMACVWGNLFKLGLKVSASMLWRSEESEEAEDHNTSSRDTCLRKVDKMKENKPDRTH